MNGGSETPCSPVSARLPSAARGPRSSRSANGSAVLIRSRFSLRVSIRAWRRYSTTGWAQRCSFELGSHCEELGEEGELERAPQERHTARAAGAGLEPDDPLDGLEMAEAP